MTNPILAAEVAAVLDREAIHAEAFLRTVTGWLIWVYPERRARPAYWFNRGPNGERPSECDCMKED